LLCQLVLAAPAERPDVATAAAMPAAVTMLKIRIGFTQLSFGHFGPMMDVARALVTEPN
jgi:hypothetical protein